MKNNNISRRHFTKSLIATGTLLSFGDLTKDLKAKEKLPIGIQLYTVRDLSAKDFKGTLQKVAQIGYPAFEFAGYGDMEAEALKAFIDELGVTTCGSHVGFNDFAHDIDKVIEFNKTLGNKYLVVPSMPTAVRNGSQRDIEKFAYNLNVFGYKVKKENMQLCYHNHSFEFEHIGDKTIWDILFQSSDAELVKAELDVAWVYNAGVDPVEILDQWSHRIELLHIKDMTRDKKLAAVGTGVIDMKKIIEKGKNIGVAWYIVEQDYSDNPILQEITTSYKNLEKLV